MQFEKWIPVDLLKPPFHALDIGMPVCTGDSNSVRLGVTVTSNGEPVDVTGAIKGVVTLPNGLGLVPFDGAKEGNRAWIDLPEDALGMAGRINVAIRSFDGGETTVLLLASATVRRVDADQYYDPTDIVGDITDLIADAEQAAQDAADALAQATQIVSYAEQTGKTDAQKAQARTNIGAASTGDISDVKSAVSGIDSRFDNPNVMDYDTLTLDTRFVRNTDGQIRPEYDDSRSVIFAVEPSTTYYCHIVGGCTRFVMAGNTSADFVTFTDYPLIESTADGTTGRIFTTGATTAYVMATFLAGDSEYVFNPANFRLYKGSALPADTNPRLKPDNMPVGVMYNGEISEVSYTKNRCPETTVDGILQSGGTISAATNWVSTDFCPVSGLGTIIASAYRSDQSLRVVLQMQCLCTYDSNKQYLGFTQSPTNVVEIGSNVAYVRFSYRSDIYSTVQVEYGSAMTRYVEYAQFYAVKNSSLKPWSGKLWAVVGDSLTEVNARSTHSYYDYISDETGIGIVNMGVSGTGYANGQASSKAFYQRIANVPTNVDVVTIFGSFNDYSTQLPIGTASDSGTTTIGGCVNATLDALFNVIPLAKVGIVSPTPWESVNPYNGTQYGDDYIGILKAVCERRGVPFLDLYHCSLLRPWDADFKPLAYSHDNGNGTHPDENGHKMIAPMFKSFVETLLM